MLKLKLDKTAHATLSPEFQKEYKAVGDDFILDTDIPVEDVTPLKNSLVQEREAHKKTKADKQVLEGQIVDLTARAGTATELETSWQKKLNEQATKHTAEKTGMEKQIHTLLVDNVAAGIAAEISTAPSLMLPIIKARLRAEAGDDGTLVTRVLGTDGKVTVNSVKELTEELRANKEYAAIIQASKASGGGASGGKGSVGDKAYSAMTEAERTALYKADKPKFDRLRQEHLATTSASQQT